MSREIFAERGAMRLYKYPGRTYRTSGEQSPCGDFLYLTCFGMFVVSRRGSAPNPPAVGGTY